MIGITSIFRIGVIVALLIVVSSAWSYASKLADVQQELDRVNHELALQRGRDESYKRMIDRRDAAIGASKCKDQITHWVRNPDEIPQPFDPFNQLVPPNLRGK